MALTTPVKTNIARLCRTEYRDRAAVISGRRRKSVADGDMRMLCPSVRLSVSGHWAA